MTDVPLSGNEDWRKVLKELPLPLSVQKDQLLIECLDSITNGGYVDVVTQLLNHGAQRELKNNSGKSAIDIASEGKNKELILVLTTTI